MLIPAERTDARKAPKFAVVVDFLSVLVTLAIIDEHGSFNILIPDIAQTFLIMCGITTMWMGFAGFRSAILAPFSTVALKAN